LKRRLKADKKAKEKAEKSAAAVPLAPTASSEPAVSDKEAEDIDPNVSCLIPSYITSVYFQHCFPMLVSFDIMLG